VNFLVDKFGTCFSAGVMRKEGDALFDRGGRRSPMSYYYIKSKGEDRGRTLKPNAFPIVGQR